MPLARNDHLGAAATGVIVLLPPEPGMLRGDGLPFPSPSTGAPATAASPQPGEVAWQLVSGTDRSRRVTRWPGCTSSPPASG